MTEFGTTEDMFSSRKESGSGSEYGSWLDRLNKGSTFKDWNLFRPQVWYMYIVPAHVILILIAYAKNALLTHMPTFAPQCDKYHKHMPGPEVQSLASPIAIPGAVASIRARCHTFVGNGREIFSTVILLLPLIQERLLSVMLLSHIYESACERTAYLESLSHRKSASTN